MKPVAVRQFLVFGELVEVLVTSAETKGAFCVLRQYSKPGGGPPLHMHEKEDEVFTVIEGEYDVFDGERWNPVPQGGTTHTLRNNPHTFRNRGTDMGCMQAIAIPGGLDIYLEELSRLSIPPAIEEVVKISNPYGITFLPPR